MKYAFDNANLLDGTKDMRVQPGLCVLTDGETITDIVPAGTAPAGYTRIDLRGRYLLPGLINMHVHLAGSGKIQKKQRDNEKLVRRILGNPVARGRVIDRRRRNATPGSTPGLTPCSPERELYIKTR